MLGKTYSIPFTTLFPKLGGSLASWGQLKCISAMYERRTLSCEMVGEDLGKATARAKKQGRRGEEGGGVAGVEEGGVAVAEAELFGRIDNLLL